MTALRRVLRRRIDESRSDNGMTLVELIVAMGIFTVVVSVFMAGIVVMTKSTARAQAVGDSGDAALKIFQRFDKQVRYASSINGAGAGATAGTYYVEYLVSAVVANQSPVCYQWQYSTANRTLAVRSWKDVAPRTPTAWSTVATNVRNDLSNVAERPFVFTAADPINLRQQLSIHLDIGPGPAGSAARKGAAIDSNFVARNSSAGSPSNKDSNLDGLSDTPVCDTAGRP